MKFKSLSFYLSFFCFPISLLAFINLLYSSYFDYFLSIESYFITLIVSLSLGIGFYFLGKKSDQKIDFINQLILIILVYLIIGFLISIPFYLSNFQLTFLSAFFESISGLTGTGFSTFKSIKYLDPTLILWRSTSQWIGGLYFLFFLILIFSNKTFNFKMTNLTYSGDNNFKTEENIKDNNLCINDEEINNYINLYLPKIKGDRVVQIGTCFNKYGNKDCYLKHLLTISNDLDNEENNHLDGIVVERCKDEKDLLNKWFKLIEDNNPDIITGYNIYNFDGEYIFNRCLELGLTNKKGIPRQKYTRYNKEGLQGGIFNRTKNISKFNRT